jgi:predicted ATPase
MIFLRNIALKTTGVRKDVFPLNLALMKTFKEMVLSRPVTFFVGENGSGKSTLLEAIAAGTGSVTVGGEDIRRDKSLAHARLLASQLQFVWNRITTRGFFLRAEDFFGFTKNINAMNKDLEQMAREFEGRFSGYALQLAKGAVLKQKQGLVDKYGDDADACSHGESFLKLFQSRFVPGGLYLLDEPEAPLSPLRQLSFLSMLKEMVLQEAQFIIATHSPILMAFPDASILNFDKYPICETSYDEIEHVTLTKAFLNNPQSFLRHL